MRRCPECGTRFRARDESRRACQEEIALLDGAERATARAVIDLLPATLISVIIALMGCGIAGQYPVGDGCKSDQGIGIALAISFVIYGLAILWLGRRLLHALRLDNYRGVIGAFLVFAIWSLVGMLIQFFLIVTVFSFD